MITLRLKQANYKETPFAWSWRIDIKDKKIISFSSENGREGGTYLVKNTIEELANIYNLISPSDRDYLLERLNKHTNIKSEDVKLRAAKFIEDYKTR